MKQWPMFQGLVAALVTVLVACGGAMMEPSGSAGGTAQGGGMAAGGMPGGGTAGGLAQAGGAAAGGSTAGGAAAGGAAGGMTMAAMYPAWQLTDLQPQSPRFNQSYGLSAFQGRALVVVMIEGF
jgi:hypothetical protein